MTTLRAFTCDDLFRFNNINLDPLTETYGIPFYLQYLAHWPEYFIVAEAPGGELMGYIMGKAEGSVAREEWHGHVTALSVAPEFRRLGLAAKLMELLEEISEKKGGFFVDLFVRVSNQVAVNMYKQLGYSVYRTVLEYYSASSGEPDEDAYGKFLFSLKLNGTILMLRVPGLVCKMIIIFLACETISDSY
ncbi:N-alpha-acetyltransferase 20 isoform X1 [Catharus ustulatus]|uniref:N-alpha-acetyltransferase 20 isoform X1 n=1 Tax=Catharus ustulatus TaxID=91951 RepID=UPI001409A38D|nr:N-alpha-acetyltransferase 20 isoform X1 [Catharus ustulatus]